VLNIESHEESQGERIIVNTDCPTSIRGILACETATDSSGKNAITALDEPAKADSDAKGDLPGRGV